jgi:hypothetical protein
MHLKQISIPLENSRTRACLVTRALEEQGIAIEAMSIVDAGPTGELRILAPDLVSTRNVLMRHHVSARVDDVVAVEMVAGGDSLSQLLAKMVTADIRIKYAYRYAAVNGKSMLAVAANDNQKVIDLLDGKAHQN